MDLKLKIVAMLFVIVAIGYAIYFIMNDFNNQKSKEKIDRRITETYEDYDIRKQVLNQLDSYNIDKKVKTTIYDSMSTNMEKFKEMPEDKLNDFIKDIVNKTKEAIKPPSEKKKDETKKETFDDEDDDKEEFNQLADNATNKPSGNTLNSGNATSGNTLNSGNATQINNSVVGGSQMSNSGFDGAKDINNVIETTVTQIGTLERNLSQIKSMVNSMAQQCKPVQQSSSYQVNTRPASSSSMNNNAATEQNKVLTPTMDGKSVSIEGFENFGGRGYSFL